MNTALWAAQALLALAFLAAGGMKATQPLPALAEKMAWVKTTPAPMVRLIGVAEVLGAIGLLAPWGLGIVPVLTPVAAGCLVLVMVLAAGTHAKLGEYPAIGANVVLGALAAFVAWGRLP